MRRRAFARKKTYADGTSIGYTHTADGLPARTTYARGTWMECDYDIGRRMTARRYSDSALNVVVSFRYYWGKDLSESLQGAGGIGGLLCFTCDGDVYVPVYDQIGNVVAVVDSSGSEVASFVYDAFGRTVAESGSATSLVHYRFSTKYWDEETGMCYYGYRFYVPWMGRWLNRDPIEEEGGHNLYLFVFNSPQYSIDVLGNEIYYFVGKSYLDENEQKIGENKDAESFEKVMILNALESSNNSTKRTKQDEFHITYSKFASIDTLISLIKKANANDHIIIQTHGSPSGIMFGDVTTTWSEEPMECFIRALKRHCKTLTLRVCYVSQSNAKRIKETAELDHVFYSPEENTMMFGAFGLNPVYADPTSYIPTSFEFDPSRQGLRKE